MKDFLVILSVLILFSVGWLVLFPKEIFCTRLSIESLVVSSWFLFTISTLILIKKIPKFLVTISIGISVLLLIYLDAISKNVFQTGEFEVFLEHSLKNGIPFILLLLIHSKITEEKATRLLQIFLSLVFIGHGLYAIGLHTVPTSFIDMINCFLSLPIEESKEILFIIGIIDICIGIIYLIFRKNKAILIYLAAWAVIVTSARLVTAISSMEFLDWMKYSSPEIIWRMIHVTVPFYLLKKLNREEKQVLSEN